MADLELNALNWMGDLGFDVRWAVGLLQEKHTGVRKLNLWA